MTLISMQAHRWLWQKALQRIGKIPAMCGENVEHALERRVELQMRKHLEEHYPLQYLLQSQPFAGLDITVRRPILIPRYCLLNIYTY
jgi:methylase of polypeptide subunit release factors